MSGMFSAGEIKVRPGAYSMIRKAQESNVAAAVDGITAVLFKSNWGPLEQAVEITVEEGYSPTYGTELTTDIIEQAFAGGAKVAICCRIGTGGTAPTTTLQSGDTDAITIQGKYVGDKEFSITVRDLLTDDTKKECVIYAGTKIFETFVFDKSENEIDSFLTAFGASEHFIASKKDNSVTGVIKPVMQQVFTAGTNPTSTIESYTDGFSAVESFKFNTICVDTEEVQVHALMAAFLNRIYELGQFGLGVVTEKQSVALATRMEHAAGFNDEKMHYVLNSTLKTNTGVIEGYQSAARIAGMIASCPSSKSLTHTIVNEITELVESLTPTQITKAEKNGCLVLTYNSDKKVWIDNAINTLISLKDEQDAGWKKIRRTKTRYELLERAVIQADSLVGKVDNDANGRATIVSQISSVGQAMIEEGKLLACTVTESVTKKSNGDTCYFDIDVIDKDSAEHIYLTFFYRFSTNV